MLTCSLKHETSLRTSKQARQSRHYQQSCSSACQQEPPETAGSALPRLPPQLLAVLGAMGSQIWSCCLCWVVTAPLPPVASQQVISPRQRLFSSCAYLCGDERNTALALGRWERQQALVIQCRHFCKTAGHRAHQAGRP